ncbi:hypothetical protein D1610_16250 [Sphingomonas gilva]|uniref:Secreted protein n=1 Tax=Sphingomonas gilva TaxID=2305907 RepID=A0A396RJN6_9SPHN|nr:hypothetical protein [Sphingomonas gilva]RHW16384.1 hypothetical protein D1610_16250 [Sphingomonas gilva]
MPGRAAAFVITLALAAPVFAQDAPPERIVNAEVYGADPCPEATEDEIVVCKRLPESERYRLPKRFREPANKKPNAAWATRVQTMDEVGRVAGGLPNTCSPIGSGGHTGCTQAMIDAWYADRRARQSELEAADNYVPE